jgi:hypothetical protein
VNRAGLEREKVAERRQNVTERSREKKKDWRDGKKEGMLTGTATKKTKSENQRRRVFMLTYITSPSATLQGNGVKTQSTIPSS